DRPATQFGGGAENANGDFRPIRRQQLSDRANLRRWGRRFAACRWGILFVSGHGHRPGVYRKYGGAWQTPLGEETGTACPRVFIHKSAEPQFPASGFTAPSQLATSRRRLLQRSRA